MADFGRDWDAFGLVKWEGYQMQIDRVVWVPAGGWPVPADGEWVEMPMFNIRSSHRVPNHEKAPTAGQGDEGRDESECTR